MRMPQNEMSTKYYFDVYAQRPNEYKLAPPQPSPKTNVTANFTPFENGPRPPDSERDMVWGAPLPPVETQ